VNSRGKKMVDLCKRLNIQIETTKSGTRSTTSEVAAVPQEEIKEAGTSEENEEEKWTGLIKQVQDMGKWKACRVQVLEHPKKMKTKGGKAKHGEKPQPVVRNRKTISSIYWIFMIAGVFLLCCSGAESYYFDYYKLAEQWIGFLSTVCG